MAMSPGSRPSPRRSPASQTSPSTTRASPRKISALPMFDPWGHRERRKFITPAAPGSSRRESRSVADQGPDRGIGHTRSRSLRQPEVSGRWLRPSAGFTGYSGRPSGFMPAGGIGWMPFSDRRRWIVSKASRALLLSTGIAVSVGLVSSAAQSQQQPQQQPQPQLQQPQQQQPHQQQPQQSQQQPQQDLQQIWQMHQQQLRARISGAVQQLRQACQDELRNFCST